MLNFIDNLEKLVISWPQSNKLSIPQIADHTATPVPKVIMYLGEAADHTYDLQDTMNQSDLIEHLDRLKTMKAKDLEQRARELAAVRQKAFESYEQTMEKVRVQETAKNWRGAFKNLTYFIGENERCVSREILFSAVNDALRLGIKANMNMQELGFWFKKLVVAALERPTFDTMCDLYEYFDAFGLHFLKEGERGQKFLLSLISMIKHAAIDTQTLGFLNHVMKELSLPELTWPDFYNIPPEAIENPIAMSTTTTATEELTLVKIGEN